MLATEPATAWSLLVGLIVALGVGLLIGADRERRKGVGPSRAAAGLRTFTVASLTGAVAVSVGGEIVLAAAALGIIAMAALSYWRSKDEDPGITTEAALVLTTLLGALAVREPTIAAGLGVLVAGLLHARSSLHVFVQSMLSEEDVRDTLILAGATLVVLPLLPDRPVGPYGALNLRALWLVVILVMSVSAIGYVSIRAIGARFGLPIAGLASGFISSVATIGAMGARVERAPARLRPAVAGAVLSTVATIVQLAVVLAATSIATLQALYIPLICAGAAALCYGALFTVWALQQKTEDEVEAGRAVSLPKALLFAAILAAIVVTSAALREWFGTTGAIVGAAAFGLADTHSAAVSVAALVAAGKLTATDAVIPIVAALSTNTLTKIFFACTSGDRRFALAVVPGLILVVVAAWIGMLIST
jgi:uncharacterized membrane protein (DUF4010 family)